jgi:DNA repair protein RadC
MKQPKIRDLPRAEKPREKLIEKGPEALKDSELLAILLGSGYKGKNVVQLAKRILTTHPLDKIRNMPLKDLRKLKGIGYAKGCLIRAAFELAKRAFTIDEDVLPVVKKPKDVANQVTEIRKYRKESFVVLYLNARNQVIHKETVSMGTLNASLVHPREVFQPAVAKCAASVILTHNHPSGNTSPSEEDAEITRRMVKAGQIMGIEVLDHVIVSERGHRSLKEEGLL